jgi:sugar lactone lactonase YvrE
MRSNDGAIDPVGRLLAGTMTDPTLHKVENEGTLFRVEQSSGEPSKWTAAVVMEPVKIPNGLGWSVDGRTMYHTDSPTYTIWAYDYDMDTGAPTNRRPWFVLKHADEMQTSHVASEKLSRGQLPPDVLQAGSEPDGFAFDANGDIWSAVYGAGKVLRIRDVNGHGVVVGCVTFPAANVTCPRFVDEDLIVTSAQGSGQYGGSVFRIHVGVSGRPLRRWKASGV